MKLDRLKSYLDKQHDLFNQKSFIKDDPISIPHRFKKQQDREIIGFWTAMLSWGQRVTIINKATELIDLMDGDPHNFILGHKEKDRKRFANFKHRTFQYTDTLYFLEFFQHYYQKEKTLESAFIDAADPHNMEAGLTKFHERFFSLPHAPQRTRKHVSTPVRKSTCKRLNMFLRWMVRQDDHGVDFGCWNRIKPSSLYIPLDVHVDKVARSLGMIDRKQTDWRTVLELTEKLRLLDSEDPVKYDYALFGMGVLKKNVAME